MKSHLWQGEWIDDSELERRLGRFAETLVESYPPALSIDRVLAACARLASRLDGDPALRERLARELGGAEAGVADTLSELSGFLRRESLQEKVSRELSSGEARLHPFRMERIDSRREIFESWAPLGLLVHIAPTNAANVPFLSVIEGLLCGNVNLLKTGSADSLYPQLCLEALLAEDASGRLREHVIAARFSSSRKDLLRLALLPADGVAVWGSEEALEAIRGLSPPHARFIGWGPKISFSYFEKSRAEDLAAIEGLAAEVCRFDQQACSSPQVAYLETSDPAELERFARRLADALSRVSPGIPALDPSPDEQAELTQVIEVAKLESALEESSPARVLEAPDRSWRVLIDPSPALRASPLYRTIWIKPLPRERIVATLRPLRHYLQTVGLEAPSESLGELTGLLFRAGALRVTRAGSMVSGYVGEPHDGVYALQRYSRRVSVAGPEIPYGISSLEDLGLSEPSARPSSDKPLPLLSKADLAARTLDTADCELFVKSGGSSGEPQLSCFTYDDYRTQMRLAAQGLLAAGLDPGRDRAMNLFFAGGLYGGFLSFFTILEELKVVQFPMAAHPDTRFVAKTIADQKVTALLGMPSYLWNLFQENAELLGACRSVRKIFFGGEHFTGAQRRELSERFGVELIRSAAYGSNDTGPIGYQCGACEGSVHHLHQGLQELEILHPDHDAPVSGTDPGRLILSSRVRRGQNLLRYEIGDLGRWVPGSCPCGRGAPRFELLGRYGDLFKAGGSLLDCRSFVRILEARAGFTGESQLVLSEGERLTLRLASPARLDIEALRKTLLAQYADLREVVETDLTVTFRVEQVDSSELQRTPGSGKLKPVLDLRNHASGRNR